jgi:asparagine synthase (glutamine-hydrolysing)
MPKLRAAWRRMPWRPSRLPALVTTDAATRANLRDAYGATPARVTGLRAVDGRLDGLTSGRTAQVLEQRAVLDDLTGHRSTHPFLDPDLVAAVLGLAPWLFGERDDDRALQRAAFADRLPDEVLARRSKAEFSEIVWPSLLRAETLASIRSGPLVTDGWVDAAGFEALVANARVQQADAARPLARCAYADRWLRRMA